MTEPKEPEAPVPEPEPQPPEKTVEKKRHRVRRGVVRAGGVLLAVVIGVLVAVLTIDLGPKLRERAEREGSNYMHRPMRIGSLSARLIPGTFIVENLVIEGLSPTDPPFLTAKKIVVRVPWWSIATKKLIVESVDMTDWDMTVETFPNGRHSFPKVMPERKGPQKPSWFTTTVRTVQAARGQFTYRDHGTPWSTIARNLNVTLYRSDILNDYRGSAGFSNGTIRIMSYEPFTAGMKSRFKIVGGQVVFDRIDLDSDGARSVVDGTVDLKNWPEQLYRVKSHIDFPTQKDIFFHRDRFTVTGQGDFEGTFHLFRGGRELKGTFVSPVAGVNDWRFPNLRGKVLWVPDRLEITDSTSEVYGGTARFDYRMAPMGKRDVPTKALWDVAYKDVDLARLTDFLETRGLRLAGRATGRNTLEWPLGKWGLKQGGGVADITPPPGVEPMTREFPEARLAAEAAAAPVPFDPRASLGYLPIGGHLDYRLDPEWITLASSWVATPKTYVEFEGRTAYGPQSKIPFHVTSLDWQESDRVLAGIMTTFGSNTGAIEIGGHGEFDGVMLESFSRPRIEGRFSGDNMRAWDVVWGRGTADVVIENSYASVKNAVVTAGQSEILASGLFSLGYPRRDGGEQINAVVRLTRRPMVDLKHAFELDDYDMDGLVSGEYHVYGNYETPLGFGRLLIEEGIAYGETFDTMTSALRFEGTGVRLDTIDIRKASGSATGAAYVGWDGDYSFNVDGRRIPVESLKTVSFPTAPLSGLLQFNATGAGRFEEPRYDVKVRIDDLFAGDEGVGAVSGRLAIRGLQVTGDFEAASPRLFVSGSGRVAMTDRMEADMNLRFQDTSLDPYVRFFEPRLSPFTTAVAGGTIRVAGELSDINHLTVDTQVETLDLKLFDYALKNDGVIDLALNRRRVDIRRLRVTGEGTLLQLGGQIDLAGEAVNVEATGEANLGILQGFFRNLRSRGTAALLAHVKGPITKPSFSGSARLADGRIRHLSLPHGLEAINGIISFDGGGIRIEDVSARMAGGEARFGGRIAMNGFTPGQLSLTAVGEQMRVRYPEGFNSLIDADLWLRGEVASPTLGGTVTIHDARWTRRLELDPSLFDFVGSSGPTLPSGARRGADAAAPLRHPGQRRQHAADSQQSRRRVGQRRPQAAGHLRSAGAVRPRRDRPRQHRLRGQSLRRDPRHRRLPDAAGRPDRADLRHRGGNTRPRAVAELPDHARGQRHDEQSVADARLGSAAVQRRHHRPAGRHQHRRDQRAAIAEPRCLDRCRGGAPERRRRPADHRHAVGAGPASGRGNLRARDGTDRADDRQRQRSVDGVGPAHSRQAPVVARLHLVYPAAGQCGARPGHRARIRSERPRRVRAHADRGPYVRDRLPGTAQLLMRVRALLFAILTFAPAALFAQGDASRFAGRRVSAVSVAIERQATTDVTLTELIETRVGEPLSVAEVRETIAHLYSLGRFQDVQVEAIDAADGTVALRYTLIPIHAVERVEFEGSLGLSEGFLRDRLQERFGRTPQLGRSAEATRMLERLYQDHGYFNPSIRVESVEFHDPDRTVLTFRIDSGPQARIRTIEIEGDPQTTRSDLLSRLGLVSGRVYERVRLDDRLTDYVNRLKKRGHLQAAASHTPRVSPDGTAVDLTLDVRAGPMVTVAFQGDLIPDARRDELAPFQREGSVDEDLIEDSIQRIRQYLREQGYWRGDVTWEPKQTDTTLTVVFTVRKGPLFRVAPEGVQVTGNKSIGIEEIRPLIVARAGRALYGVAHGRGAGSDRRALPHPWLRVGGRQDRRDRGRPRRDWRRAGASVHRHRRGAARDPRGRDDQRHEAARRSRDPAGHAAEAGNAVLRAEASGRTRRRRARVRQPRVRVRPGDLRAGRLGGPKPRRPRGDDCGGSADHRRPHHHRRQPEHRRGGHPPRGRAAAGRPARASRSAREPAPSECARVVPPDRYPRARERTAGAARRARHR